MKYYAIKRPDGAWIMGTPCRGIGDAWRAAARADAGLRHLGESIIGIRVVAITESAWIRKAKLRGYCCVEVSGFEEVKP